MFSTGLRRFHRRGLAERRAPEVLPNCTPNFRRGRSGNSTKGIGLGCSIGDPRGCDDPVESAGTAGPRLVSDGNGCAFRSTSSSTRSLGFVPRRRGFTVACHGECQRCPDLVADRRVGVRFGFGMFPSLETKGTIPNHQVRAGLFVREYSPAIEREQRKCARCNRN